MRSESRKQRAEGVRMIRGGAGGMPRTFANCTAILAVVTVLAAISSAGLTDISPVMPRNRVSTNSAVAADSHGLQSWRDHGGLAVTSEMRDTPSPLLDPIITSDYVPGMHVVRSSVGITIEIKRPEDVPTDGTAIFYTMSGETDVDTPSCGIVDGSKAVPPNGEEYQSSLHFCGNETAVTIRAVLCPHGGGNDQPGVLAAVNSTKSCAITLEYMRTNITYTSATRTSKKKNFTRTLLTYQQALAASQKRALISAAMSPYRLLSPCSS